MLFYYLHLLWLIFQVGYNIARDEEQTANFLYYRYCIDRHLSHLFYRLNQVLVYQIWNDDPYVPCGLAIH